MRGELFSGSMALTALTLRLPQVEVFLALQDHPVPPGHPMIHMMEAAEEVVVAECPPIVWAVALIAMAVVPALIVAVVVALAERVLTVAVPVGAVVMAPALVPQAVLVVVCIKTRPWRISLHSTG